jgi:hypothetical protein
MMGTGTLGMTAGVVRVWGGVSWQGLRRARRAFQGPTPSVRRAPTVCAVAYLPRVEAGRAFRVVGDLI